MWRLATAERETVWLLTGLLLALRVVQLAAVLTFCVHGEDSGI